MPTISVDKASFLKELGREYASPHAQHEHSKLTFYRYTTEEFDELCFEFGTPYSHLCFTV